MEFSLQKHLEYASEKINKHANAFDPRYSNIQPFNERNLSHLFVSLFEQCSPNAAYWFEVRFGSSVRGSIVPDVIIYEKIDSTEQILHIITAKVYENATRKPLKDLKKARDYNFLNSPEITNKGITSIIYYHIGCLIKRNDEKRAEINNSIKSLNIEAHFKDLDYFANHCLVAFSFRLDQNAQNALNSLQ